MIDSNAPVTPEDEKAARNWLDDICAGWSVDFVLRQKLAKAIAQALANARRDALAPLVAEAARHRELQREAAEKLGSSAVSNQYRNRAEDLEALIPPTIRASGSKTDEA